MNVAQEPKVEQEERHDQEEHHEPAEHRLQDEEDKPEKLDKPDKPDEEDEEDEVVKFDRRYFGLSLLFYEPSDDPPAATTYQYKPLDTSNQEMRCAYLAPGKYEDDIVVSLYHVPHDGDDFDYFALSYVWGSQEDLLPVYVQPCLKPGCGDCEDVDPNNNIIMVTRNLDTALRHLRLRDSEMPIWVDAICIDQQNTAERSQQVAFMGEIYRRAGETYVWIGPEADDSPRAMWWIHFVGNVVDVNWYMGTMTAVDVWKDPEVIEMADASKTWETIWPYLKDVGDLTNREYFTRLWVRQEVKLSPRKVLRCGKDKVEWWELERFSRWMAVKRYVLEDPYAIWTEELDKMYKQGCENILSLCRGSLTWTVSTFDRLRFDNSKLKWKEPRDAIYANLGMLAPECQQLGIEPDYDKDPADVFTDVAVRVATKLHSLGFLESCDLKSIDLENLPSWVPDWSSPLKIEPITENFWNASAWISAHVEYLGDGVMVANGVAVSEVEEVGYWEWKKPYEGQPYMVCDCIRHWCDLKPADYDERQEQYLEGSNLTWLEAWCTLFLYGNLVDVFKAGQESEVNRPDLWTLQEAKELFLIILKARSFHEIWCLDDLTWRRMERFLSTIGKRMKGRTVFKTVDGHIGIASSVWRGSMVSVLLGCPTPVILSPKADESSTDDQEQWLVASSCFVVGLMDGEAITGPLPKNCRAVDWRFRMDVSSDCMTNRLYAGLYNDEEETLSTDPAKPLEDRGIPYLRTETEPHLLKVSSDALQNAGVNLQKFVLV